MSVQRKLNALLFELQTAQSPLAQAKILARSWRTLRELSPTDRRLLARHAGFDGAEQILEGLAGKKAGFAPATLLQVLNRARATDGAAVSELLAAVRDPSRLDEAITRGASLAEELLVADDGDEDPQEIVEALDQLHAVQKVVAETQEAALDAAPPTSQSGPEPAPPPPVSSGPPRTAGRSGSEKPRPRPRAPVQPPRTVPKPPTAVALPVSKRVAPSDGWDALNARPGAAHSTNELPPTSEPPSSAESSSRFGELSVLAALEAEPSSLARLRALRREMAGLRGSGLATIRRLLEIFPNGWVRRRALVALISAGVPAKAEDALELIPGLDREVDRRWCLGALARRGDLTGEALERSLRLVASPAGRRRLQNIAARA
jgi:hypothetical protein